MYMLDSEILNFIIEGKLNEIQFEEEYYTLDNLRSFHNWIKLQLIFKAKNNTNGQTLLDVAVGRGGDLMKWTKAKFKYVTVFDNDSKSIYEKNEFDGAIKRYNTMKSIPNLPKVFFWNISATDPKCIDILNGKDHSKIYDVVSCQFAFHYFVKDIDLVLKMISSKLTKNGYFIGTSTDGDLIKNNLKNGDVSNDILNIEKTSAEMYKFNLNSYNTESKTYFECTGASNEYFLHKDKLVAKCKEYNLEAVSIKNFHEWKLDYKGRELTRRECAASFLNFSFVFKKI